MPPPDPPVTGTTAPLVHEEGPLATGERFRPLALAALTAALIALCVVLAVPFLSAIAWAVALAIIAWPLHVRVNRRIPRLGVAAGISTLLVVFIILVPGLFVSYELAREAESAAERMKDAQAEGKVRETLARTPGMGGLVGWMDRAGVDIDREVRKLIATYTRDASSLIQGSLDAAVQFVICLFVLYHVFRDRASLAEGARRLLPMSPAEAAHLFRRAADSVHANLRATLVTSLVDGVGGGLMFWAVGLSSPVLWGVVMFVLSILPIVGTFIVWMPAAAYLVLVGQPGGAAALVAWGVASWAVNDNIIYVRVAGDRMRLNQVPALIAFLGGLVTFGASGMILGPAILAVTVAVLDVWHRRASATAPAPVAEPSAAKEPEPAARNAAAFRPALGHG